MMKIKNVMFGLSLGAGLLALSQTAEAVPGRGGFGGRDVVVVERGDIPGRRAVPGRRAAARRVVRRRGIAVTRPEFVRARYLDFEREITFLDRNRDGLVTRWEARRASRLGVDAPFRRAFRGQRVVTVARLRRMHLREARREFVRMDLNGDGILSRFELRRAG